ncbi:MAG: 4Fe-4S dicluster domain-containing protein [Magnetococcales bacterium]|nr:4Fe-4S dicluster domain-containing protein [Magnetococcales bacterium]
MSDHSTSRRKLLQGLGLAATALLADPVQALSEAEGPLDDALQTLLQNHYQRMSKEEVLQALARIERRALREHGVTLQCRDTPPIPGVTFAFALNLSKCKGGRQCVAACVGENNGNRDGTTENIRVLAMPHGERDLAKGDHYYHPQTTPQPGTWYLPIQCQQCEDPPCVQACPVEATWREADGIVVIDYDWCIGCRYCAVACPYWARRFNWKKPELPSEKITTETHYLGNRPRSAGVMEKCTFCIQRTRKALFPACQEACPTGARIFGNLLDPEGEIRYILENKTIFRLKEELSTQPKFWYFTDV